jgi:hypothetical protein
VSITADIARRITMPSIRHVYIPEGGPNPAVKGAVFGLIALADDSTGFFFLRLGDTLERLKAEIDLRHLAGRSPMELATWFDSDDDVKKPLGLGAINAISQHVFRVTDYRLDAAENTMGALAFTPTDHVGMVGFFPSLVGRLRKQGVPLTVIEKKPELVQTEAHYEVTLDPSALRACNNILCTGSTLLNDTLDEIVQQLKISPPSCIRCNTTNPGGRRSENTASARQTIQALRPCKNGFKALCNVRGHSVN